MMNTKNADKIRINRLAYPTYYSLRFNHSIASRKSKDVQKANIIYGIMGDFWQSTIREKEIAKARRKVDDAIENLKNENQRLRSLENATAYNQP